MSKYDGLRSHLKRQTAASLELTFADIEHRIGAWLPKGASRPEWWSNERANGKLKVQSHAWLSVGYNAYLARDANRVRFERTAPSAAPDR